MKRNHLGFWAILLLGLGFAAFAETPSETLYLTSNVPQVRRFGFNIGNVTVGNPEIVDFKADRPNRRITLIPKMPGETMLIIFDQAGEQQAALRLIVSSRDLNEYVRQLTTLLSDVEGITIKVLDQKVVIDGELYIPEDKQRIQKVVGNAPNVLDLTSLSRDTQRIIAKKIQKEIGMDEVNVRPLKGQIILEGEVYSEAAMKKALKIAELYADRVINTLEVRAVQAPPTRAKTVQVTVHFVEVAKNYAKNFLFSWSPIPRIGASGQYNFDPVTGSKNFSGALTGQLNDILPRFDYFRSLGVVRVLENPSVSVKSGHSATIRSGTRIGFPVIQPQNGVTTLDYQNVGITLQISPFARGGDVDLNVSIEVSSLGTPDIQGGVAIDNSSIATQQFVRSGESVVIGGLLRYSVRNIIDRPETKKGQSSDSKTGAAVDDTLGSLFNLFKSSDYSRQRSQFLVFLTPRILEDAKEANQRLKEQFNLYEVYPKEGQGNALVP